jgi:hypothetical protein
MISDNYRQLERQVSEFGNHHRKFLYYISNTKDALIDRLERKGVFDQVHLWKPAMYLATEMDIVRWVSENPKEQLRFLGCYYALQFLHLNLQSLSVLNLELASGTPKLDAYRNYMISQGEKFQQLTGTYMERLLDLFIPPEKRPEFVICGCGSRADQDDIDVGIVDDGSEKRSGFNHAINQLTLEMLKRACSLHLYLSEHVGSESYSASIPEYEQLLKTGIHDFIIINEMLSATPIFGSQRLYKEFQRKVTHRYYYHRGGENLYHEGFLRGILGEIRSLMLQRMKQDRINPKDDALRMIKGLIAVGKTVFRIPSVNPWEILSFMAKRDSERSDVYRRINNALAYFEALRHIYQLYAAQEEEICFDVEGTKEHLQKVALTMGYRDIGMIKAMDHMLIHYYEYVDLAKSSAEIILNDVILQLKDISSFTQLLDRDLYVSPKKNTPKNLALKFIDAGEFFKGTRFWNDVLESLDAEDHIVIDRWVKDLWSLEPKLRRATIERYAKWGIHSPFTFLSLLIILSKYQQRNGDDIPVFYEMNQVFLREIAHTEWTTASISRIFNHYPQMLNEYLMTLEENDVQRFEKLISDELWDEELNEVRKNLLHLCGLHYKYSRYFRRFFLRVVTKYPHYIPVLHATAKVKQIARGIIGNIDSLPVNQERMEKMGEYFDLEFFRLGMQTLEGYSVHSINSEFIEFSDNYTVNLFDLCKQEVIKAVGHIVSTRDNLGVFTTGGHARHQAFDDDYDLIILLDSDNKEIINFSSKILTVMNREITKRGIMPHFRFADHFGSFITRFSQLEQWLATPHEEMFIDQSQLLEARMVVGSHKLMKEFERRIIRPFIFDKWEKYVQDMTWEIRSRHQNNAKRERLAFNFKECRGGLRDIEMLLLIFKARYQLLTPMGEDLFEELMRIVPDCKREFRVLSQSCNFLKQMRYLYRLSATADDNFRSDFLGITAKAMDFVDGDGEGDELKMMNAFQNVTQEVHRIIHHLLEKKATVLESVG